MPFVRSSMTLSSCGLNPANPRLDMPDRKPGGADLSRFILARHQCFVKCIITDLFQFGDELVDGHLMAFSFSMASNRISLRAAHC